MVSGSRRMLVFMALVLVATAFAGTSELPGDCPVSQSALEEILVQHPLFSGSVVVAMKRLQKNLS